MLAYRSGEVTQEHWQLLNSRVESQLPVGERADSDRRRTLTLFEKWQGARAHNRCQLRGLCGVDGGPVPVAAIRATDNGRAPRGDGDAGQLPAVSLHAVGMRAVLTKNQCGGRLGEDGASNGAAGTLVAHLHAKGVGPPALTIASVMDMPGWKGPRWIEGKNWVPIPPNVSFDEDHNVTRTGMPISPGWATVVHKAQGSTIGEGQLVERMRAVLTDDTFMESKFLGLQYVALSRCKCMSDVAL